MNKKEIEQELVCLKGSSEYFRNTFNEEIGKLEAQLAEAEKPKLEHGDSVISKTGNCIWLKDKKSTLRPNTRNGCCENLTAQHDSRSDDIFAFNIFDLMGNWDKDFEKWESSPAYKDAIQIMIEVVEGGIFFGNSGRAATFELKDIIEIWKQLGHAIISAKRSK